MVGEIPKAHTHLLSHQRSRFEGLFPHHCESVSSTTFFVVFFFGCVIFVVARWLCFSVPVHD